jgi:bifunctional polynucleotide phosphatase/kinase
MGDITQDTTVDGLLIYGQHDLIEGTSVLAFDLDYTLIKPKGRSKFPKDSADWKWIDGAKEKLQMIHAAGTRMVIFSNQGGIRDKKTTSDIFVAKLRMLFEDLDFPILVFAAISNEYRKPSPKMFEYFKDNYMSDVTSGAFIGDAAGREDDFSDSDRKFALNCKLLFKTPEEYLRGVKVDLPILNPIDLRGITCPVGHYRRQFIPQDNHMIILIGAQASGKSTLAHKTFTTYSFVNQDTAGNNGKPGTGAQCLSLAKKLATAVPRRIVIDATNPTRDGRKKYIDLATANKMNVIAVWFMYPVEICMHLNEIRRYMGGKHIPDVAFAVYAKKLEPPAIDEGFSVIHRIEKIPFDETITPSTVKRMYF